MIRDEVIIHSNNENKAGGVGYGYFGLEKTVSICSPVFFDFLKMQ